MRDCSIYIFVELFFRELFFRHAITLVSFKVHMVLVPFGKIYPKFGWSGVLLEAIISFTCSLVVSEVVISAVNIKKK